MFSEDILKLCEDGGLFIGSMIGAAAFFIVFIMAWLVGYIVRFMANRRSREFGTYLLLGVSGRRLAGMFIRENLILGGIAFALGLLPGMFFQQVLTSMFMGTMDKAYHPISYTHLAKCKRKIGVCPYSSVGICMCLCSMGKSCETKVIQILETKLRSNLLQTFHCNYVYRVLDGSPDRGCSSVGSGSIFYRGAVRIVIWLVFKCCGQCHALFVKSRSIGGNNLECGSGLSGGICCAVQSKAGSFFTASAHDCLYIAGMLINDAHG